MTAIRRERPGAEVLAHAAARPAARRAKRSRTAGRAGRIAGGSRRMAPLKRVENLDRASGRIKKEQDLPRRLLAASLAGPAGSPGGPTPRLPVMMAPRAPSDQ